MISKEINPMVRWWMTPKLPYQDIYELPLLKDKSLYAKYSHLFSQWLIHPIKRRIARWYLSYLRKSGKLKVIGVTGSAGKSTTVGLLESILKLDGETLVTPHSIDPVYNIPNTILHAGRSTKYLVLEMSVEYPGEMDYYLWMSKPDIGVITNIFPTHLTSLGSVNGVFEEKSKLVKSLNADSFAVLNKNDSLLKRLAGKIKAKIIWFDSNNDLMVSNINAAKCVAMALKIKSVTVDKALKNYKSPKHRMEIIGLKNGAKILDDSYNSNPRAIASALAYFGKLSKGKKKIAVIGDMLELGSFEYQAHKDLGRTISKMKFADVIGVGKAIKVTLEEIKKYSHGTRVYAYDNSEEVSNKVKTLVSKSAFIFIKGSRSIGLDKVVDELR